MELNTHKEESTKELQSTKHQRMLEKGPKQVFKNIFQILICSSTSGL